VTVIWRVAALAFSPFAAWYVQWLVRWGGGPFGILDSLRHIVLGVVILSDKDGNDYHQSVRSRLSAVHLLECSRCTLFWVVLVLMPVLWFLPVAIIGLGIMGAASLLDDRAG